MRSPVHQEVELQPKEIETGLNVFECPKSGGIWIPFHNYLEWKNAHPESITPVSLTAPEPADDTRRAPLICPESGRLLIRYKVGHGLSFHVDHSPLTGGIWLDKGEWEALKSKGLHTELNMVFTSAYQRNIRTVEHDQAMEKAFQNRIGAADFAEVKRFQAWLSKHPKKSDILCYLSRDADSDKQI